jgi:exodeoxyribonuclease V gamma subunit
MLGVASGASPASHLVAGDVLPSGSMAALESEAMHRAAGLIEAIADLARMRARGPHRMSAWHSAIAQACEAILPPADDESFGRQRMQADRALAQVSQAAADAGLDALPWPVARAEFEAQLQGLVEGRSFAVGGITLARLTPMRSVPARLLILAGIDHGVFPRPSRRDALDLSRLCPRLGDRDDRLEDQLLLLESIHAATERLVVVVQDTVAASGQPGPLSPVIEELLATVAEHAGTDSRSPRARLLHHHPTLGDQPEAWMHAPVAGFDARARARASLIASARRNGADRVFANSPDGEADSIAPTIHAVERMASVLRNPSRAWLQGQGVRVADLEAELGERCEPIELDSLEKWSLSRRARQGVLLREDPQAILRELQLQGHLPHGVAGDRAWRAIWQEQSRIVPVLCDTLGLPAEALVLERVEFTVPGLVPELRASTLWCPARRTQVVITRKQREKEWLTLWPEHLAFAATWAESTCVRVELPARVTDAVVAIQHDPVDPGLALDLLRTLRELTEQSQRRLLPLHAELLHASRSSEATDPQERLEAMRARLAASRPGHPALEAEPWFRMAWRGLDFLEFGQAAGTPRVAGLEPSFAGLGAWLDPAMEMTGWSVRTRGRGA